MGGGGSVKSPRLSTQGEGGGGQQKGFEAKSLHVQIPPQEKASGKIPPEENPSQQNASTLKYLPAKHL